ncbi:urocortin 3 [Columba livia]|uniref:Urocortin 3 n=1 Tax=Columba livia TaxID=8932 RepID=A0A2I0LXD0_COLLI|nr:urocortin 3 [Columba livia]
MPHTRLLLLLALLCATQTSQALHLYNAPEEVSEEEEEGEHMVDEEMGKRTFPGEGHYKYVSQAQVKGKTYQNRAKSDRRTKVTLSLDVPTNIMNILFNIAKAKNLRAKAAANAHLMAQIGRRK